MKKSFLSLAVVAALAAAATSSHAVGLNPDANFGHGLRLVQATTADSYGRAPKGYVAPQERIAAASGSEFKLPPGTHPNSISAQSLRAEHERKQAAAAYCSKKQACVPIIGKTADGKYPVYGLDGDIGDLKYFAGNTAYKPNDLVGRMGYVSAEDAKGRGMSCDWICKNASGQTIGLDPAYLAVTKK